MKPPEHVRIGYVRRAIGLRGEVEVEPLTDNSGRIRAGLSVHAGAAVRKVEAVHSSANLLILKFVGVDNRDDADSLRGRYLEVETIEVEPLPEGSYYHWQLLGLEVFDIDGKLLGTISDIIDNPANDVYVVTGDGGQVLIPAIVEVVLKVDLEAGRMTVNLPEEEVVG
ncbi:MAG TPA: ribosome maturation factor RimM [Candidatus Solibacter sp.]|nr:ribosome maturation factor RimM [Candidatus Solibacter sp.]